MKKNQIIGKGIFKNTDLYQFKSDFEIDTNLKVLTKNKKTSIMTKPDFADINTTNLPSFHWTLEGIDALGRLVLVKEMSLLTTSFQMDKGGFNYELGFTFRELIIGSDQKFNRMDYFIPNLVIGFDESIKRMTRHTLSITKLSLELDGNKYFISFRGYEILTKDKKKLIAKGNNNITTKITIEKENDLISFVDARTVIDMILVLISLAYGDRVTWFCGKGYKGKSEVFKYFHDDDPTSLKPFRKLIRIDFPQKLSNLIKVCFPVYASLKIVERKNIDVLIEGILFSAKRLHFPIPFIILSTVIEKYAEDTLSDKNIHYINKTKRKALLPSFKKWIDENVVPLLEDTDLSDFGCEEIKQKLSAVVQRNLQTRIIKVFEYLDVDYELEDIKKFVRKRNAAAHGGYVYDIEDYLIWTKIMAYLEIGILKKINYSGEYADWSISPPVLKILETN